MAYNEIRIPTPGPGDYKLFSRKEGAKYTMAPRDKRSSSTNKSFIPGPGEYKIRTKPNTPSFKMGTSKREFTMSFYNNNPGPAHYKPNKFLNSFYNRSPQYTMGAAPKKINSNEMGPGPGNIGKLLGDGPKVDIIIVNIINSIQLLVSGKIITRKK
jgi:hypothetical protein